MMPRYLVRMMLLVIMQPFYFQGYTSTMSIPPDEAFTSEDSLEENRKKVKITAYPAAGYAPETSLSFGAVGFLIIPQDDPMDSAAYYRPSSISPYFLYTLNRQLLTAVDLEIYPGVHYNVNTTFRYFNYPDYFYGIGPGTSSERELFTNRFFKWDGNVSRAVNPDLFLGIAWEWMVNRLEELDPAGNLISDSITGVSGGSLFGLGPMIRYDTRDNILYPKKGIYLEVKPVFYPDLGVLDYALKDILIDFRAFRKIFSEKNILALQFFYRQATGERVPFYKLPRLGGDTRLRGIEHENRYVDHHMGYIQLEGRQELFWRLSGVLFAGVGNVGKDLTALMSGKMKFIYGIGGRFRPFRDELLNVRLDIGKGPGSQFAIYLAVREAF